METTGYREVNNSTKNVPLKKQDIVTIEWHMLNKSKFFPLSMTSSFCIRCVLHPLSVVKTKIQVQKHASVYSGTFDALHKIVRAEGAAGLYRGFWISAFQSFSSFAYMGTYEGVRDILLKNGVTDSRVRGLCGGAAASAVSQTLIVPFDVVSQHLMVIGQKQGKSVLNPLNVEYKNISSAELTSRVVRAVYSQAGVVGFYRGYCASLITYVPNSAMWWTLYHTYQEPVSRVMPISFPTLATQCIAASLGGATTAVLTNPLDILRARLQVNTTESSSIVQTFKTLWKEEQCRIFTKGLSARLMQTVVYSSVIICGYESVKRLSVNEDYKHVVKW